MNNGEEINWVQRRKECSTAKMFEKLRLDVEQDVKERHALRPEGCWYGFKFNTIKIYRIRFSVFRQSNQPNKSVTFSVENDEIVVKNTTGAVVLKASITLNDEGECKFKIDGKERESWHLRKLALEDLFFGSDLI